MTGAETARQLGLTAKHTKLFHTQKGVFNGVGGGLCCSDTRYSEKKGVPRAVFVKHYYAHKGIGYFTV